MNTEHTHGLQLKAASNKTTQHHVLRDAIAHRVVGAHSVEEGGEQREHVSVLCAREVRQPPIHTTQLCNKTQEEQQCVTEM